ncbi:MAG: hypothetical protein ACLTC3_12075 [Evtepia gabavorous]
MEQKFPMEQGWLLCRETGGRAELTMEVPGGSRGLYRGYVLGERGLMDLGTLLPEGMSSACAGHFPWSACAARDAGRSPGAGCR